MIVLSTLFQANQSANITLMLTSCETIPQWSRFYQRVYSMKLYTLRDYSINLFFSSGATTTSEVPMIAGPAASAAQNTASAPSAMTAGMETSQAAYLAAKKFAEFFQSQQQRQKELNETTPPMTNTGKQANKFI